MKYLIILGDGMADRPIESLNGKTPLEYADTPMMDELASKGEIGMVHTIPDGMKPGSDTQIFRCWAMTRGNFIRGVLRWRRFRLAFR